MYHAYKPECLGQQEEEGEREEEVGGFFQKETARARSVSGGFRGLDAFLGI